MRLARSIAWLCRTVAVSLALVTCALALLAPRASAQVLLDEPPVELQGVDVSEQRGNSIPLDTILTDQEGRAVRLGDYFDGRRPVLLLLAYYDCPMLCNMMLGDLQRAVQALQWGLGKDYRVVVLSFDHTNTLADARVKRDIFTRGVDAPKGAEALAKAGFTGAPADPAPFLLATEQNARAIADSVGFGYRFDPRTGEYAHPSVVTVLTPAGTVSNYLYGRFGSQYNELQARLSLADASAGRLGSVFEKALFWCYRYDPHRGAYAIEAFRVMQLGAGLMAVFLFSWVGFLFWSGRRRPPARSSREVVPCA